MQWIILSLTGFYVFNALYYFYGLRKLNQQEACDQSTLSGTPFISIIVPARNEESGLEDTLQRLLSQRYPSDRYEIIAINDRSTDRTRAILNELAQQTDRIIPVHIQHAAPCKSPKKQAIEAGIKRAKGEIIVTTDADVETGPDWLESLAKGFDSHTGLVAGITLFRPGRRLLSTYQALDSASLSVISAAMITLGHPLTCQASNLAYRKQAFDEVNGFSGVDHITSGDDDLLMQKINLQTEWHIKALVAADSLAYTEPVTTLKALINQRSRWASKGAIYPKKGMRLYLILLYLALLGFVLSFFFLPLRLLLLVWAIKLVVDFAMTAHIVSLFQEKTLWRGFLPVVLFQPLLVAVAGLLGSLGKFTWK